MSALRPHPWSVFRRIAGAPDFEVVGTVQARTEGEAAMLATRLPNAPRYPIVCHAPMGVGMPTDVAMVGDASRRSRRYAS